MVTNGRSYAVTARTANRRCSDTAVDVLLDGSLIWVATCDAAGNLDFVSPALQEFFGVPFSTAAEVDRVGQYRLFTSDGATPLAPSDLPLSRARRGEVVRDALIATRLGTVASGPSLAAQA